MKHTPVTPLPWKRAGWKRTMARRSIQKMALDSVCHKCGGIGFLLNPTKRPANIPCEECQQ